MFGVLFFLVLNPFPSRYINTNMQAAWSGASSTRPRGIPLFAPPLLLHCQSAGPSELCLCAFSSSSVSGLVSGAMRHAIAPKIVPLLRPSKHKDDRLFITPPHATSAARNAHDLHVPEAAIEAFQLVTRHRGKGERRGSNNSRGFATCPVQRRRS